MARHAMCSTMSTARTAPHSLWKNKVFCGTDLFNLLPYRPAVASWHDRRCHRGVANLVAMTVGRTLNPTPTQHDVAII